MATDVNSIGPEVRYNAYILVIPPEIYEYLVKLVERDAQHRKICRDRYRQKRNLSDLNYETKRLDLSDFVRIVNKPSQDISVDKIRLCLRNLE